MLNLYVLKNEKEATMQGRTRRTTEGRHKGQRQGTVIRIRISQDSEIGLFIGFLMRGGENLTFRV